VGVPWLAEADRRNRRNRTDRADGTDGTDRENSGRARRCEDWWGEGREWSLAVPGWCGGVERLNGAGPAGWVGESGSGLPVSKAFGWLVLGGWCGGVGAVVSGLAWGSALPARVDSGDDHRVLLVAGGVASGLRLLVSRLLRQRVAG
jgi:hypothetical protein